jgi:endoglucanase
MFRDNERVIGMDVRNEVRRSYAGEPTWGDGTRYDWKKAAETAGNRIHKIAPHWLIVVGGMNYQTDFTAVKDKPV